MNFMREIDTNLFQRDLHKNACFPELSPRLSGSFWRPQECFRRANNPEMCVLVHSSAR